MQSDIIKGRDLIPGESGTEEIQHVRSMTGISRINQVYNGVTVECGFDMQCVDLQNVKDNVNDDVMTRHDEYYIDHFHHHDYRHHHEIIGV